MYKVPIAGKKGDYMGYMNWYPSHRKKPYKAKLTTAEVFSEWLELLIILDTALYEWEGLPDSVDTRCLELDLCYIGSTLCFKDDIMGEYYCLPCNFGGKYDIYGKPLERIVYSPYNNYHNRLTIDNSVIIMSNYLMRPHYYTLLDYAERITNIVRTLDINVNAQKTPFILISDETQRLSLENLFKKVDDFEPAIHVKKEMLDMNAVKTLQTEAPYLADRLDGLFHNVFNEALTFMGYNNANQDKKERLVASEVQGNNASIAGQQTSGLIARKRGAYEMNRMFGFNCDVKIRENLVIPQSANEITYMYPYASDFSTISGNEASKHGRT